MSFLAIAIAAADLAAGAHAYFDKSLEFEQARDCIARLAAAPPRAS